MVREAEGLDRPVGAPAAVLGHPAGRDGAPAIQRAAEVDAKPRAGSGLDRAGAGALGDRQADPLLVAARVLDHQGAVGIGGALQSLDVGGDRLGVDAAPLVEADQAAQVGAPGEQHRARRLPVAPRPPGLLVVGLDAGRDRPMPDGAHVGLVDAHAEGVRGDDDLRVPDMKRCCAEARSSGAMPA